MMAVIQAGGKGVRLRPYTMLLPKPLMPVGDLPVIEVIVKWLRRWGVTKTYMTVGYLGHLIRALCGDGNQWGIQIDYNQEPEPLGTIGALKLLKENLTETFFNINSDLITDLNLRALRAFHVKHGGLVTVAVTERIVKTELGVFEVENDKMVDFHEKPTMKYLASCGVYCMEPEILDLIPNGSPFGFDDLMNTMLHKKMPVWLYRHDGLWLDIGREEDYKSVQQSFMKEYKLRVLGC
ncbi:MAG: nucleotidyltransferase [Candidatus Aminicenantes bacterium]|nr:MAG: nucleotidyltransferase [Candidatus Aminicenantes bacterium]